MSAGIAPPDDISIPEDKPHTTETLPPPRRLVTLRQLNTLAVAIVLSASGLVCVQHLAFVVFSILYVYFLSRAVFPRTSPTPPPPVYGRNNKILTIYVTVGAVIGLFLPILYILHGLINGDKEGVKSAAPHVFLLSAQILMEGVTFSGGFSLPVRVFVPVVYNSIRISSILEWVSHEWWSEGDGGRAYVGEFLAFANLAFWSFNLFGFLIPFYIPKAFKLHYSDPKLI